LEHAAASLARGAAFRLAIEQHGRNFVVVAARNAGYYRGYGWCYRRCYRCNGIVRSTAGQRGLHHVAIVRRVERRQESRNAQIDGCVASCYQADCSTALLRYATAVATLLNGRFAAHFQRGEGLLLYVALRQCCAAHVQGCINVAIGGGCTKGYRREQTLCSFERVGLCYELRTAIERYAQTIVLRQIGKDAFFGFYQTR